MPAAVRGGSRSAARPPTKAPPKARAARPATPPREAHGLSPKWALIGAATVLTLALGATLATGHRGEMLVSAIGTGVDGKFGDIGFRLRTVEVLGASRMATAD